MENQDILKRVQDEIQSRNYSYRTEQAYTGWIERLIRHSDYRHPMRITPDEITKFLNYLAVRRNVSGAPERQCYHDFTHDLNRRGKGVKSPLDDM